MAAEKLGGTIETVLEAPRVAMPPPTLDEAREQPGRADRIKELAKRIEDEDIRYVFFQQASITGRVMGKGVVASFFPQVAQRGYQLVYGATANLFTDRDGNYIGFGPEESELAAIADLDTFSVLPWDERVARVSRSWRLSYQPLTSAWRVSLGVFSQSYPSLDEALSTITRIAHWRIADSGVEPKGKYYVEFSFKLDASQLPRPMQLDLGAQADWHLGVERTLPVE